MRPLEAVSLVFDSVEFRQLRVQSAGRLRDLLCRFASYAEEGYCCSSLDYVTLAHVMGFIHARSAIEPGASPSFATMHLRRSAVRLLFRVARRMQLAHGDPTLDIALPPRSSMRQRPLTDDEILLGRSYALRTLTETRQPAMWALAEATARTSEIPLIRISQVDIDAARVFIPGTLRTEPRWGSLTEWGAAQVSRRLRSISGLPNDPPIVYSGRAGAESAQASACDGIASVLARAGLGREPDLGPGSVAAWAGAKARSRGAPVEEVARILGVRSLDRAARIIGWDWRRSETEP